MAYQLNQVFLELSLEQMVEPRIMTREDHYSISTINLIWIITGITLAHKYTQSATEVDYRSDHNPIESSFCLAITQPPDSRRKAWRKIDVEKL